MDISTLLQPAADLGVSPNRLVNIVRKLIWLSGKDENYILRGLACIFKCLKMCHCYKFDDLEWFSDEELMEISGLFFYPLAKLLRQRIAY